MPRVVRDQLYRKVAWRLIPFLLACYTVAIIDRFNIGFAKLQFLQDLKMNDAIFGLAAGIFSIGYVALEVPSNLLLDRIGARKTLLRIMVLWGTRDRAPDVRSQPVSPLYPSLPARRRGGWLLPRNLILSHALVSPTGLAAA